MQDSKTILEALDLPDLTPEEQEEMLADLDEMIFQGTLVRLLEMMDEKTQAEFEALMERDAPPEEIEVFLDTKVPNSQQAVDDTIREMTDDILALTQK